MLAGSQGKAPPCAHQPEAELKTTSTSQLGRRAWAVPWHTAGVCHHGEVTRPGAPAGTEPLGSLGAALPGLCSSWAAPQARQSPKSSQTRQGRGFRTDCSSPTDLCILCKDQSDPCMSLCPHPPSLSQANPWSCDSSLQPPAPGMGLQVLQDSRGAGCGG